MENSNELWLDIVGYEGLYKISSIGRVLKVSSIWNKLICICVSEERYVKTNLRKEGKTKQFLVHRLVAEAFIGSVEGLVVDHINGIMTDNRVENLRICTQRENCSFENVKREKISKYAGVSWSKRQDTWISNIQVKNRKVFLGIFKNEIDAHLAYQRTLEELNS